MNPGRSGSELIHLEREKTSTLHVRVQVGSVTHYSGRGSVHCGLDQPRIET